MAGMHSGNMSLDHTGQDLKGQHFKNENFQNFNFAGADLRGTVFESTNLRGAHFSNANFGLRTSSKVLLFVFALLLSLLSGFIAMLAGTAVQRLIQSPDQRMQIVGYITMLFFIIFVVVALWKGLDKAISKVLVTLIVLTSVLGLVVYVTGLGTGMGAVYAALALLLMAMMFVVGTIARATIGTMGSTILFLVVALGGGMFGKSLGGGAGTVVMALACALISKRALKEKADTILRNIALRISTRFGTSFKNADLTGADFSDTVVKNTDFSNATLTGVNWTNAKKVFTLEDDET